MPAPVPRMATRAARAALGADWVPATTRACPGAALRVAPWPAQDPAAVYVPSCIGALFGPADGSRPGGIPPGGASAGQQACGVGVGEHDDIGVVLQG
jgi:hypothetical protein